MLKRLKQRWDIGGNSRTGPVSRYGSKRLKQAKRKVAIKLKGDDEVMGTLKMISDAFEEGKLDAAIE